MRTLQRFLTTIAACMAFAAPLANAEAIYAPAGEAKLFAPLPAQKSLYSFADVYRLTVAAAGLGDAHPAPGFAGTFSAATAEGGVRTVSGAPQGQAHGAQAAAPGQPAGPAAPSPVFAVSSSASSARPDPWLLLLAGLVAAAWVARRRLGYSG